MKNVVLAVDGSSASQNAAWTLAHLPHPESWRLTVITVVTPVHVRGGYGASELIQQSLESQHREATQTYQKAAKMFEGANVAIRHVIREGNAPDTIVECAIQEQADLVVVGATGRSQLSRVLLGSVSDYVATHAPCSVLVVRPTDLDQSNRPPRIVIGYEDTGAATAAIQEFLDIEWGSAAEVHVLSIAPYLLLSLEGTVGAPKLLEEIKAQLAEAVKPIRNREIHVYRNVVESEHIGNALVDFAEENQSDFLFVGETKRGALSRVLLGSVSRFVLRHATCSVWITRNRILQKPSELFADEQPTESELTNL